MRQVHGNIKQLSFISFRKILKIQIFLDKIIKKNMLKIHSKKSK